MKKFIAPALVALMAVPLAACGGDGDDKLAGQAEDRADEKADAARAAGANEAVADNIEEQGEARADAIDASDVDADELSDAQKNALVEGR